MNQETNEDSQQDKMESLNVDVTPEEYLNKLAKESEQFKAAMQRAQADLVNYRRRSEENQENLRKFSTSRLLTTLLPVLDEFNLALGQAPNIDETSIPWMDGIRLIHRKLHSLVEAEGVSRIEAEGKLFDPLEHEAIAQQESYDHEDGEVIAIIRDGYKLHERILRPSQVIVSKKPESVRQPDEGDKPPTERKD